MNRTYTLKLNRDFRRLYARGKYCASGYVVVYCMKNRLDYNRIGLTVGKVVGNAVKRNRAKRLMRESYRLMEDKLLCGYDFVLVARAKIVGCKYEHVSRDMNYAMKKLGMKKT